MNRTGKEIMACRIAEAIKDTFSKKESSAIPLHWKQDTEPGTAAKGKGDVRPNMEESTDDTGKNQSLQMERDNENCNSNSDTLKSTISANLTVDSDDTKATFPKRDKRYKKTKNEDFLWF